MALAFRVWKAGKGEHGAYPRGSGLANGHKGEYYLVKSGTKVKVLGKFEKGWHVILDKRSRGRGEPSEKLTAKPDRSSTRAVRDTRGTCKRLPCPKNPPPSLTPAPLTC